MPGTQIKVFDKIVQVIEVLATSSQSLTLRQVQDASGLNKGTAFRILRCLQSHNLAARSADGTYSFGDRVLWWASRHEHNPDLSKLVRIVLVPARAQSRPFQTCPAASRKAARSYI